MTKVQALGSREDEPSTVTVLWQQVAVGEKFVHLGSLIHLTIQSSPDISRRNAITFAAMQNLDNQMWKSRISISTKLKLYITCILPSSYVALSTASPLENWMRPPERPHTTWMKTIQQDLKSSNLSLNEAIDVAQNRPLWRLMSMFGAMQLWWCLLCVLTFPFL